MYVFYSKRRESRGEAPYLSSCIAGRVDWGSIKKAKFFNHPEEILDYLIITRDPSTRGSGPEVLISWMAKVGRVVFHHPLNVPE